MKFSNVMIITDLDGTFYKTTGGVPESNLEAVDYFKKNGGLFTIASGRTPCAMGCDTEFFTPLTNAPAVLCNGAYLYDFKSKERISEVELNYKKAVEIANAVHREFPHVYARISIGGNEFRLVEGCEFDVTDGKYSVKGTKSTDISNWTRISFDTDRETADAIRERFEDEYKQYFAFMKACPEIYEFQDIRGTKGQGLDRLREYLKATGLAGEALKIYAVGDFENDLDLLTHADVAACPENALDCVKAIASVHLCHCNDGAIADLIGKIERGEA